MKHNNLLIISSLCSILSFILTVVAYTQGSTITIPVVQQALTGDVQLIFQELGLHIVLLILSLILLSLTIIVGVRKR